MISSRSPTPQDEFSDASQDRARKRKEGKQRKRQDSDRSDDDQDMDNEYGRPKPKTRVENRASVQLPDVGLPYSSDNKVTNQGVSTRSMSYYKHHLLTWPRLTYVDLPVAPPKFPEFGY